MYTLCAWLDWFCSWVLISLRIPSAFLSNLTIFSIFSGVGGQIDFLRGAALALDGCGKPILALNSVTKKGESKIVPFLKEGKSNGCRMDFHSYWPPALSANLALWTIRWVFYSGIVWISTGFYLTSFNLQRQKDLRKTWGNLRRVSFYVAKTHLLNFFPMRCNKPGNINGPLQPWVCVSEGCNYFTNIA